MPTVCPKYHPQICEFRKAQLLKFRNACSEVGANLSFSSSNDHVNAQIGYKSAVYAQSI